MGAQPRIRYQGDRRSHQCSTDGITFASAGEAERYLELCCAKLQGEILDFSLQPVFEILPSFRKNGELFRPLKYLADFRVVYPDGHIEIEDVKGWRGFSTPEFKMKRKLVEHMFPHITVKVVKRAGKEATQTLLWGKLIPLRRKAGILCPEEDCTHPDGPCLNPREYCVSANCEHYIGKKP